MKDRKLDDIQVEEEKEFIDMVASGKYTLKEICEYFGITYYYANKAIKRLNSQIQTKVRKSRLFTYQED